MNTEEVIKIEIDNLTAKIKKIESEQIEPLKERKRLLRLELIEVVRNRNKTKTAIDSVERETLEKRVIELFIDNQNQDEIVAELKTSKQQVSRILNKYYYYNIQERYFFNDCSIDIYSSGYNFPDRPTQGYYAVIRQPHKHTKHIYAGTASNPEKTKKAAIKELKKRFPNVKRIVLKAYK